MAAPPTVPKVIELPLTVPLRLTVFGGVDSVIEPLSVEPVCSQVSLKVPVKAPLY